MIIVELLNEYIFSEILYLLTFKPQPTSELVNTIFYFFRELLGCWTTFLKAPQPTLSSTKASEKYFDREICPFI